MTQFHQAVQIQRGTETLDATAIIEPCEGGMLSRLWLIFLQLPDEEDKLIGMMVRGNQHWQAFLAVLTDSPIPDGRTAVTTVLEAFAEYLVEDPDETQSSDRTETGTGSASAAGETGRSPGDFDP